MSHCTDIFTHIPPLFTVAPLMHYLTSPPHAAASKKGSLSTNEAWDHFADDWLIPQMHQPDQSPIYCLLITALRAALLSSRKKKQIYYKDLGHDNCWYPVRVCVCVCSHMAEEAVLHQREHAPFFLSVHSSPCFVWMSVYLCVFLQLACNYWFMFNEVRC